MSKKYRIYLLTAKDGRCYVGMTSLPLRVRCTRSTYKHCTSLNKAISEMGWESFRCEELVNGLTCEEASLLEQEFIGIYDSTNPSKGFNIASGGVHFQHNEVSKNRISESSTPRSDSFRKKKYDEQEPFKHGVSQLSKDGVLVQSFPSIKEAAKKTNTDASNIRKCANGTLKTTNGFCWKFI